jgi:acetyl-CoA C-acetyltransferase
MTVPPTFIFDARRTPIGALRGLLAGVAPGEIAAAPLRVLWLATGRPFATEVVLGSALGQGNVARYAALSAGLPVETPAWTVNAQCTSGLTAVRLACERAAAAPGALLLAGGVESCSQSRVFLGASNDARPRVAHAPTSSGDPDMGPAADATAAACHILRDEQDTWALASYARAMDARGSGLHSQYITPVEAGAGGVIEADALPKRLPSPSHLRHYPPAFAPGGTVTAGNAAPLADGAAAVAIAASALPDARPLARVVAFGTAASDPRYPALAVVPAVRAALGSAHLPPSEIDRWEVNEAFAVKLVALVQEFDLDPGRVNVNGGAIAFGHPFGASGAIAVVHLVHELRRSGLRYGVAAIAGAGGLGEAIVLERAD